MEREGEERKRERERESCSGDTFPDRAGVETMNRPTGVVPANLQAQRPHCHPCVPPSPRLVTAEGCFADLDGPVAIATAATANLSNLFSIHTALEHEFLRLLRNRASGYASSDLSAIPFSFFPPNSECSRIFVHFSWNFFLELLCTVSLVIFEIFKEREIFNAF